MKNITIDFPGGSLLDMRKEFREYFYTKTGGWYSEEKFANENIPVGKYTVNLEAVPDSSSKTFFKQQALIGQGEIIPPAAVLVYAMIQHKIESGEYTFPDHYARCSDLDSDGVRVIVGFFDARGLVVDSYWDSGRVSVVGLASARKIEPLDIKPSDSLSSDFETRIAKLEKAVFGKKK